MARTRDFHVPANKCPHCQKCLDACFTPPDSLDSPSPGDPSVCIGCGGFLVFEQGLQIRALTEGELLQIMLSDSEAYETLLKARNAVLEMKAGHKGCDRHG